MVSSLLSTYRTAYVALGSNLGRRHQNLLNALDLIASRRVGIIKCTSGLYETVPMYLDDQPKFLNAVFELETHHTPNNLLDILKEIELDLGRKESRRYGERLIDIDILFYEDAKLQGRTSMGRQIEIPHPRIQEREFVLRPLNDIAREYVHPTMNLKIEELLKRLMKDVDSQTEDVVKVLVLGSHQHGITKMWNIKERSYIMGILNVTPDSFSDGGRYNVSTEIAVQRALSLFDQGADIVDIGGESTRPGAEDVNEAVEIKRITPIIRELKRAEPSLPLSVDTRKSSVAAAAVEAGADMVNDVSGGLHDPNMLETVANLGVPYVGMHMRGTPQSMASLAGYGNLVLDIIEDLKEMSARMRNAGIPNWMQIMDPGLGFAKNAQQNVTLLANLPRLMHEFNCPFLVGPSRKKFVGLYGGGESGFIEDPSERDWATVGAVCASIERGATIARVHNVRGTKEALRLVDAIRHASAHSHIVS